MLRTARNLAAGSLCFLSLAAPAIAADPIGTVVASAGSPKASGPGGSRELSAGSPIYEDDRLSTGGGNVQIMFIDRTKLLVGPGSTLVIERFLLRGGNSVRKFSIDALRGTFRFISGNSRKVAYDIRTANATIGIHGTAFDVSTGSGTLVAVYKGKVGICAYGKCESIDQYCGVARAARGDVAELSGRAKARALRSLPYVSRQSRLSPRFRVDTSGCATILGQFGDLLDGGSQRDQEPKDGGRNRVPDGGSGPNPQ
jgi:hypothetical protein